MWAKEPGKMFDIKSYFRIRRTERQQIVANLRNLCVERDLQKRSKSATEVIRQIARGIELGRY